ncbi:hypothetical protein [Aeoliella sp.]|uniref:hypothetical protein n=1 Tax=Aeoliella sp. TaxID=2795800 RepID=UPI003CCB8A15
MFDFLLRRGNPTNHWTRAANLKLAAELDVPSLNGVTLGSQIDLLSSLGRDDSRQLGTLCYADLGVGIDYDDVKNLVGYTLVLSHAEPPFQPYSGEIVWNGQPLQGSHLTHDGISNLLGEHYWLDSDDDERIAFFEFPQYEIQVEFDTNDQINGIVVTSTPLMANPEQREAYGVDKPWPPTNVS